MRSCAERSVICIISFLHDLRDHARSVCGVGDVEESDQLSAIVLKRYDAVN